MKSDKGNVKKGVLFVMPRSSMAWKGAEALWITVAGWASAAERLYGNAWILTKDRVSSAEEAVNYPPADKFKPSPKSLKLLRSLLPEVVITAINDFILWRGRYNASAIDLQGYWDDVQIAFIWQQHDLFSGPGKKLAEKLGVPLVTYVHAPIVWETRLWGVHRPIWGRLIEKFSEKTSFNDSDLVACVSEEVARQVALMGVSTKKIVVSPMCVDPSRFPSKYSNGEAKNILGLGNRLVIGWTGSFRRFHGLESLIQAFAKVHAEEPNTLLVLVGDGAQRISIENLVAELGLRSAIIFVGRVANLEVPKYLAAFDISVVSSDKSGHFHYSPLKLREYLVCGKPTVAPRVGEIPVIFKDEEDLLLYNAGDAPDMAAKMLRLIRDPQLRRHISERAPSGPASNATWDFELNHILSCLNKQD